MMILILGIENKAYDVELAIDILYHLNNIIFKTKFGSKTKSF